MDPRVYLTIATASLHLEADRMNQQTVKVSFPKGHTSMAVYSGSLKFNPYEVCIVHDDTPSDKTIRLSLFKDISDVPEDKANHTRKVYSTQHGEHTFKAVSLATQRFMGFERARDYKFRATPVPVYVVNETDRMVTVDLDLTGETIRQLIKNGRKNGKTPKILKSPKETRQVLLAQAEPEAPVAVPVKPQVQKHHRMILAQEITLADLKRMGFRVLIADADDNTFAIDIR